MAVDHEQMVAEASTAAEQSVAREAQASTETRDATTPEAAPPPAPIDRDAWLTQYRTAPDDVRKSMTEALLGEEPIRQTMSAENSRAIQRANQRAQEAQAQQAETRLDYILADENHPEHYTELEKHGTGRQELAVQRVGIRTALERPEVRAAAKVETGRIIVSQLMQHAAFAGIGEDEWSDALNKDDIGAALGDAFTRKLEREKAAWLHEYAPAIEAQAIDTYRAGLPNPDAGRSVTGVRQPGPLTPEAIRAMDARDFVKNADAIWAALPSGRRD